MADQEVDAGAAKPDAAHPEAADELNDAEAQPKSDTEDPDSSEGKAAGDPDAAEGRRKSTKAKVLRISVSFRALLVATVIVVLLASQGYVIWLYIGAKTKLDQQAVQADNDNRAEKLALDYAVDAARIDYQDLDHWKKDLIKGTTPELEQKLNEAGKSMEQVLVPLQWKSDATPLVAKVRSRNNGIYVVSAFVAVNTKTMQAPDGLQSTASYAVTIDSNNDWKISDVGGIGTVIGQK